MSAFLRNHKNVFRSKDQFSLRFRLVGAVTIAILELIVSKQSSLDDATCHFNRQVKKPA